MWKLNKLDQKLVQRIQQQIANEDNSRSKEPGPRPVVQEQQDAGPGKADHRPKKAKVDAALHPKFRVTVILANSDNRRRDLDGQLSTLLDCLVVTARRLAPVDSRDKN